MSVEGNKKAKKLIRDLLTVLISGTVTACLAAALALYFLSPSGTYKAGNVLLSPKVAFALSYQEVDSQTRKPVSYIFDHIELVQFDWLSKQQYRRTMGEVDYQKIYSLISEDRSFSQAPESVVNLFETEHPSILTIFVKQAGLLSSGTFPFQEMQILSDGDYYRIQLRQQAQEKKWAYFFHENIYKKIHE